LQRKKTDFLEVSGLDKEVIKTLKPLVKQREARFTRFYALSKRKVSRQTFVNHLAAAVDSGILLKRESGKNTYYSLAGKYPEEALLAEWLKQAREGLNFLPEEFVSYI
jgi:DNA-binding transcriptional ArsR family regulator